MLNKRFRPPTLNELKKTHAPSYNTDEISLSFSQIGIHTDNDEALHMMENEHGEIIFNSGVEFPPYVYRGQIEEFIPCTPGLGRLSKLSEKLISLCRNIAFSDLISKHPYVSFCTNQEAHGKRLHINKQGLAQHYGFHTDLLDVTSNFDVACFFASCYWDSKTKSYKPVLKSERPGVIYRINPVLYSLGIPGRDHFNFVGWQPLNRPALQRACSFKLNKGECFISLPEVEKIFFKHDADSSVQIWESFNKGKDLFPDEPVNQLAIKASSLNTFTYEQINRAWDKLEEWEGVKINKKAKRGVIKESKIKASHHQALSWKGVYGNISDERHKQRLNNELKNIRVRMTYNP